VFPRGTFAAAAAASCMCQIMSFTAHILIPSPAIA
jgi:hypothetical protein